MCHVLDERDLKIGGQFSYHTPIKDAEAAIRCAKKVTGVRVTVQRSCLQHHSQVCIHRDTAQDRHIILRALVEPLPHDPLRRENFDGGALLHYRRRVHNAGQGRSLDALEEFLRVPRLGDVIQLVDETSTPLVDHAHQIRVEVERALQYRHDLPDEVHVERDAVHDVRTLHLDGNLPAVGFERGLVDLPQTRRGDGLRTEVRKYLTDGLPQLLLDDELRLGGGESGDVVLKGFETPHVRRAQQVRPDGE
mmetsp:Transcript_51231/g.153912  ORF Transcript_51231/g.153912 Transcript_51231/m.153912 type:complete len:249 (-) Transcript_51231:1217-1963(-)